MGIDACRWPNRRTGCPLTTISKRTASSLADLSLLAIARRRVAVLAVVMLMSRGCLSSNQQRAARQWRERPVAMLPRRRRVWDDGDDDQRKLRVSVSQTLEQR